MEVIKSGDEISLLFSRGSRIHTPFVMLIVGKHEERGCQGRVAFIAGKKLGGAIWRNAAKRRMREVCREICRDTDCGWPGYDVVFLAKSGILNVSYSKVLESCRSALGNMGARR